MIAGVITVQRVRAAEYLAESNSSHPVPAGQGVAPGYRRLTRQLDDVVEKLDPLLLAHSAQNEPAHDGHEHQHRQHEPVLAQ